jgi:hypothetical protein
MENLFVNVFKGYQMAQDKDFAQFVKRKRTPMMRAPTLPVPPSWMLHKTSTRLDSLLENGAFPLRNRSRSLPSRPKWTKCGLQLLLRRKCRGMGRQTLLILRKLPVRPNLKERRNGPRRRSFLRNESQSPRLLMAPPTISNVNTTQAVGVPDL